MSKHKHKHKSKLEGASGGIFMIGLGVLFLVDGIDFWPWILVVIGLTSFPASIASDGIWAGFQSLLWMVGLAILFYTGLFWPGILILIGLSIIVAAFARPPGLEGKAKRDAPVDDEDYDE